MADSADNLRGSDERVANALLALPSKPGDDAKSTVKKAYSERVSAVMARALAQELRDRGLTEARPAPPGHLDSSGAERRMSGGIGAKKVDVSWATEESGLMLGISVKSINFVDNQSKNFQKNLPNRCSDMLFESVTLHRRFPFAVLLGFFLLDAGAREDNTEKRRSTYHNAHRRLAIFTGRDDPAGRDEQYERLVLGLLDSTSQPPTLRYFRVGAPDVQVTLDSILEEALEILVRRNPDFFDVIDGRLLSAAQASRGRGKSTQEIAEPSDGDEADHENDEDV